MRAFAIFLAVFAVAGSFTVHPEGSAGAEPRKQAPELVSRASGASGAHGNAPSGFASVTANGRLVAFASEATNLDPADTDPVGDIFVRDLRSNTTTLISRASGPNGASANGFATESSISADGRYVVFSSAATNLAPDTPPGPGIQVFLRDRATQQTTLVSRVSGAHGVPADRASYHPSISANGRYVAFASDARNLHPDGASSTATEVYVRDLATQTTTLASRADGPDGPPGRDISSRPAISADGRYVAFNSYSQILSGRARPFPYLFVRDLVENTTVLASRADGKNGRADSGDSPSVSISADGRLTPFIGARFRLGTGPRDSGGDVFLRDLKTDSTTLVSRGFGKIQNKGHRMAVAPFVSGSGRYVSFTLGQPYLGRDDGPRPQGLFVRDVVKGKTTHVLASPRAGTPDTIVSTLNRDGSMIAFATDSTRLSADDRDRDWDVYAVRLRR